jgi:hypothetical protein
MELSNRKELLTIPSILNNKKILFISVDYMSYPQSIGNELVSLGAIVNHIYIEPRNIVFKFIRKLSSTLGKTINDGYHLLELKKLKSNNYDFVFFLQVHQIGSKTLARYKKKFNKSVFVLYNWDSLEKVNYANYISDFDQVFSFDIMDSNNHKKINYLPLFYTPVISRIRKSSLSNSIDLMFVGTIVNLERYYDIIKVRRWAKINDVRFYDYCLVSPITYVKLLIKGVKPQNVHFNKLPQNRYLTIFEESNTIIDVVNNKQTGYSMRCIESIGAGKKLFTHNRLIRNEKFYNSDTIYVYENINGFGIKELAFLKNKTRAIDDLTIETLSLKSWLTQLFTNSETKSVYSEV